MADNVVVTAGTGTTMAADEVVDATLGTVKVQFVKIMDGVLDGTTKLDIVAEDEASAGGEGGILAMAVRKATPANLSGLDGDFEYLQVSAGRLWASATIDAALPAGTNAIGKLAANSGVDIGDVDVTTVGTITPGTAPTSLGKAEDGAHTTGDVGVMGLAVRQDTPANLSNADGDYEPLQMSGGKLWTAPLGFFTSVSTDITRPADTTAYAAKDALSDSTSAPTAGGFTFTSAARKSGGSGIITDAIFATSNDPATTLQGELWIFNAAVTNINDNTAFAVTDAEIKTCVGKIPFTLEDAGNNGFAHVQNLSVGFTASGSANLRFLIRVKNAYTPASAEVLTCILKIIQVD